VSNAIASLQQEKKLREAKAKEFREAVQKHQQDRQLQNQQNLIYAEKEKLAHIQRMKEYERYLELKEKHYRDVTRFE